MNKKNIFALVLVLLWLISIPSIKAYSENTQKIDSIVQSISEENVAAILKKLESFQTRNLMSSSRENFGIAAASEWIHKQFESFDPKLNVFFDSYDLPSQGRRLAQDITLRNVIAVLPGKNQKEERIFLINAHLDSISRGADGRFHRDQPDIFAPGVNDDGSGVAALLEMSRVFSQMEFDATIYFVAFSGEESGLIGSTLLAQRLKAEEKNVEGVLTLDMIGNIEGGNGIIDNKRIRVFSAGPEDSSSRQLARYTKKIGERYFPSAWVDLIFRADRFGRGGDHTPFVIEGFPGVRIMEANENFSRQHTQNDTFSNISVPYCTRNIKIVASVLASLASAPPAPNVLSSRGSPQLGRGKSGYDAQLRWNPVQADDLEGYKIYWRKTTSPYWDKGDFAGNVTEHVIKDLCIDEYVFGVSAVDEDGFESMISPYVMGPRSRRTYKVKE
jgi:hypothetical protein